MVGKSNWFFFLTSSDGMGRFQMAGFGNSDGPQIKPGKQKDPVQPGSSKSVVLFFLPESEVNIKFLSVLCSHGDQ